MVVLYFLLSFHFSLLEFFCKKDLYLIANLLICSIILKFEDKLMYVYFSL